MAARKAAIPKLKLSKILRAMAPEYVLGTTYTLSLAFFESVVLPQIKREQLKRCLLLCDQVGMEMAMSEAPALRYAARDYMVATAPARGTFHAKVWLLISRQELVLLVGSGNLTQPGFIDNVELFDAVHVRVDEPGRGIATEVVSFLHGLASLWSDLPNAKLLAVQTLGEIAAAVEELLPKLKEEQAPAVRFLSSFAGTFPRQLAPLRPEATYVAAPYFGNSLSGIEALQRELGARDTHVFPAMHSDGKLDVPVQKLSAVRGAKAHRLAMTSRQNRFAHLKLYGFKTSTDEAWLFTGSVNCTTAALLGPNVEAGLLRPVTADELDAYFEKEELTDGSSTSHLNLENQVRGWLVLWATDFGDHISLQLVPSHDSARPLVDVELTLKSGQKQATLQLDKAFQRSGNEHVAWRLFGEFRGAVDTAVVAELRATDIDGREVRGRCLIDDFATLTSDPAHRSAWRAAVALLSTEGLPEYGDISALFHLAEVVTDFDGDDQEQEDATEVTNSRRVVGSTKEAIRDKAAIWPPVPLHVATLPLGHVHGAGNIYWFNRILTSFLQRTAGSAPGAESKTNEPDENESDDSSGGAVEAVMTPAMTSAANRLWAQARRAADTMRERLGGLEIKKAQAHRLWGPAIFVSLGVMHVARAVRNKNRLEDSIPTSSSLVRTWLGMLFADRDQGEDYAGFSNTEHSGRFFPAVALDLWQRFQVSPHLEVCAIVAAAFMHLHAAASTMRRNSFPLIEWLIFRLVAGDLLAEATRDEEHLSRLWHSCFRDDREPVTWDAAKRSLDTLLSLTWSDHPGVREVQILKAFGAGQAVDAHDPLSERTRRLLSRFKAAGFKSETVSRLEEACANSRCSRYGIETAEMQALRELRPVICPACGHLLIPDLVSEAMNGGGDGRPS